MAAPKRNKIRLVSGYVLLYFQQEKACKTTKYGENVNIHILNLIEGWKCQIQYDYQYQQCRDCIQIDDHIL